MPAQPDAHHGGPSPLGEAAADILGVLLVAPLVWAVLWRDRAAPGLSRVEHAGAAMALGSLLLVTLAIYSGWLEEAFAFRHTTLLVLPPAVWLALRYPKLYTLVGNLAVVLIAEVGTALGNGPFSDHTHGLPILHLVFTCTTLLMAASQAERTRANAEVERLATRDALTDLPNRNLLAVRLENALENALRQQHRVAVMFIDLDRFKRVNDTHGHDVGDTLLVAAAGRIKGVLRGDSTLARVGGDEFVAVLEGLQESQDAMLVAQRLISVLTQPFEIGPHCLRISGSVGIASYPADGSTGVELIKHADMAMYEAKANGRDQFRFFSPSMNVEARQRSEAELALRDALSARTLELRFQPQLLGPVPSGLHGAAVVPAWRGVAGRPRVGSDLERVAHSAGLSDELLSAVIAGTIAQLSSWRAAGCAAPAPVMIRVDARALREPAPLARRLGEALRQQDIDARDISIAIPEAALQQLGAGAGAALDELSALGLTLVACDVGGGPIPVGLLSRLPLAQWWLDESLAREIPHRAEALALVLGLWELGRSLGVEVGISGIESAAHRDALGAARRAVLSGDAIGPALPADAFARRWLRSDTEVDGIAVLPAETTGTTGPA